MNVRQLFRQVSTKLRADFEMTKEALHRGGKGTNREDLVRELLGELHFSTRHDQTLVLTPNPEEHGDTAILRNDHCGAPRG